MSLTSLEDQIEEEVKSQVEVAGGLENIIGQYI